MFKRFKKNWNDTKDNINPSKLVRIDSKSIGNTFLTTQVEETIQFCKIACTLTYFPEEITGCF